MQTNKKDIKEIAVIASKLLVICAIVAALVASVNLITKDRINLNRKIKTAEALTDISTSEGLIFTVDDMGNYVVSDAAGNPAGSLETADLQLADDIDAVYIIKDASGKVLSYCVEASPMGFKNEINMIVAVNYDRTVKDVQIISLSDTKGIGDKVKESSYLGLFKGKTMGFASNSDGLKQNGLIIAGATRTSEPVSKAVDLALAEVNKIIDSEGGVNVDEYK